MIRSVRLAFVASILLLAACGAPGQPSADPAESDSSLTASASPAPAATGPTTGAEIAAGHYECQQFVTGSGWSYFGWIDIEPGGRYDSNSGEGTYSYDPETHDVAFTGVLHDNEFAATYPAGSANDALSLYFYTDPDLLEITCSPGV